MKWLFFALILISNIGYAELYVPSQRSKIVKEAAAGGGISSLNALTGATQTFATGTTGTDFAISSSGTAHTFNLPTASASNRGLLSTSDWSLFNAKESALTFSSAFSRSVNTISLNTVGPTAGGTGITTYATGDILYASASNTLSKLAAGTNGHYLTLSGGVPAWAAVTAGIGGSTGGSDNRILRSDGTGGATLQDSPLSVADTTGSITGQTDFKVFFENSSTKYIGYDSGYDSNAMRFAVPSGGYFAWTINGTTSPFYFDATEILVNGPSIRFAGANPRLGYSAAGSFPAPPTEAYFKNIYVDTGANTTIGTATLVGGTVTVNTTKAATGDLIFCSRNAPGGTVGHLDCSTANIVNGTSFVINSSDAGDTSTVNWHIIKTF